MKPIGYFVENGKGGFYGGIGPDSDYPMSSLWPVIDKGAVAPDSRSNFDKCKISSLEELKVKWGVVMLRPDTTIKSRWLQNRGLWKCGDAIKAIEEGVIDQGSFDDGSSGSGELSESDQSSDDGESGVEGELGCGVSKSRKNKDLDVRKKLKLKSKSAKQGGKNSREGKRKVTGGSANANDRCFSCLRLGSEHRRRAQVKWIRCDSCNKWVVGDCEGVQPVEYEQEVWYCKACCSMRSMLTELLESERVKMGELMGSVIDKLKDNQREVLGRVVDELKDKQRLALGSFLVEAEESQRDGNKAIMNALSELSEVRGGGDERMSEDREAGNMSMRDEEFEVQKVEWKAEHEAWMQGELDGEKERLLAEHRKKVEAETAERVKAETSLRKVRIDLLESEKAKSSLIEECQKLKLSLQKAKSRKLGRSGEKEQTIEPKSDVNNNDDNKGIELGSSDDEAVSHMTSMG
jgi:hypothetical protein